MPEHKVEQCGAQMCPVAGGGFLYCNAAKGHEGTHSYTFETMGWPSHAPTPAPPPDFWHDQFIQTWAEICEAAGNPTDTSDPNYVGIEKFCEWLRQNRASASTPDERAPEGWISVEEKLPEPVTDVLMVVQRHAWSNSGKTLQPADNWVQIGSMRPDKVWIDDDTTIGTRDEKRRAKCHKSEYREVTHWRPLPAAPLSKPEGK